MDTSVGDKRITRAFDGIPLHYTVFGSGEPTLVLVHGWSCSQAVWREQAEPWAAARVVTLDLAGHGQSHAAATQRVWSMQAFARDVEAVVDAVGARKVALLGHSMGGAVAVEAALRLGARCRVVLGVDTFTDAAFYGGRPPAEIARRQQVFERDFAFAVSTMVDRISGAGSDGRLRNWIAAMMSGTDPAIGLAVLGALLAWNAPARWPLIGCPVQTINSAFLARGTERLPLDPLVIHELEDVGHFVMLEAPERFHALASQIVGRHLGR